MATWTATRFSWGEGKTPSMVAQLPTVSIDLQPWSFDLSGAGSGGAKFAINFDWIHKDGKGASDEGTRVFAERLRGLPGMDGLVDAAQAADVVSQPR